MEFTFFSVALTTTHDLLFAIYNIATSSLELLKFLFSNLCVSWVHLLGRHLSTLKNLKNVVQVFRLKKAEFTMTVKASDFMQIYMTDVQDGSPVVCPTTCILLYSVFSTVKGEIIHSISEKAMATHSSTLAWKIPWTEEPGSLQSMGSLRVDMTERLHFHFLLSCIGEGNGNPLLCSCLENPRNGGAWWAAVYGVAQSRTRLK